MTFKTIITRKFENDLDSVISYISIKLSNPIAAKNLLNKTEEAIKSLSDSPLFFPIYHNSLIKEKEYRFLTVGNYIIFYRIDEAAKTVYVARFLYSGQNIEKIL